MSLQRERPTAPIVTAAVGEGLYGIVGGGRTQEVATDTLQSLAVAAVDGGRGVQVHAEGRDRQRRRLGVGSRDGRAQSSEGVLDAGCERGVEVEVVVVVDGVVNSGKDGGHALGGRRRRGEEGQLLSSSSRRPPCHGTWVLEEYASLLEGAVLRERPGRSEGGCLSPSFLLLACAVEWGLPMRVLQVMSVALLIVLCGCSSDGLEASSSGVKLESEDEPIAGAEAGRESVEHALREEVEDQSGEALAVDAPARRGDEQRTLAEPESPADGEALGTVETVQPPVVETQANVLEPLNRFTFDLHRALGLRRENTFHSPASVALVLAAIHEGAAGRSAREISNALGVSDSDVREVYGILARRLADSSSRLLTIHSASRLWHLPSVKINPEYAAALAEQLDTETVVNDWKGDPTAATLRFNTWIREETPCVRVVAASTGIR